MDISKELFCTACGKSYPATEAHLSERAGLEMDCECGQVILIPVIKVINSAFADSYSQSISVQIGRCEKHRQKFDSKKIGGTLLG